MFTPHRIDIDYTLSLNEPTGAMFDKQLNQYIESITKRNGYNFWAVDQRCGRCYYGKKTITIPVWALKRNFQYATWYIAHECSHVLAGWSAHHGPVFMGYLQHICPTYALHHETGYKPRNAVSAGISKDQAINILTIEDLMP